MVNSSPATDVSSTKDVVCFRRGERMNKRMPVITDIVKNIAAVDKVSFSQIIESTTSSSKLIVE